MFLKKFLINFADLLVLSCLAIAQPVFDVLGRNAEFLAVRKSDAAEVVLLIITVIFLIPVCLGVLEGVARITGERAYDLTHRILLGFLVALLLLPPMKPLVRAGGAGSLFLVLVLAGVLSESYVRLRPRGLALAYLSPVVLILPGLLLLHSPVHKIVWPVKRAAIHYPAVKAAAPVVMVLFDELPLTSLMDDQGRINSLRYPNFARLADSATWYRNATTVASSTLHAVPAILDGNIPQLGRHPLPIVRDHPHTLFTLLGGSYRMNVVETNTNLCPEEICDSSALKVSRFLDLTSLLSDIGILYLYRVLPAEWTGPLPGITQSWKQFSRAGAGIEPKAAEDFFRMISWDDRPQVFERFVQSIRRDSRPALHFLHIMLPHPPWQYLPSGRKHTLFEKDIRGLSGVDDRGVNTQEWMDDPWAIQQAYKKHLLQVATADRLLGSLLEHLKEVGLFDPSLLVIAADHGNSFHSRTSRRFPSRKEHADIMAVPLFIKRPNQNRGVVDDSNIETIDIVPTMADILGIELPWKTDGQSVLNRSLPEKRTKTILSEDGSRLTVAADITGMAESIKEKHAVFGYTPEDLFRIGPCKELIGRSVKDLAVTGSSVHCVLEGRALLENVDLNSQFIPANIKGRLTREGAPLELPLDVAIALNGRISGVTQAYRNGGDALEFSLVLPERDFRSGYNQAGIYLVSEGSLELKETRSAELPPYRWGEVLSFGSAGNAEAFQTEGWDRPEDKITWTRGRKAELVLSTAAPRRSAYLRLFAGAYLKPGIVDKQRVKVYVNRRLIADWIFTSREFASREAAVPKEILDSTRTVLTIETPDAVAPASIGDGRDVRTLGLAVSSLSLSER